jgi:signal transduction histidine kinase
MGGEGKIHLNAETTEILARLMGRIVHDFNNPLAAILGFADLLRNPALAPDKKERYIGRIHEQAVRLSQLVETMSFFSQNPEPALEPMDLGRIVADVLALRKGGLELAGLEVDVRLPQERVMVAADRNGIVRIFHAMLTNIEQAFKENPACRKACRIAVGADGQTPFIELQDAGPGVPDELRERIFEPFFSTRKSGGLGLGLTVARNLARRMDGDLLLMPGRSPDLGGAVFRLVLKPA